MYLMDYVEYSVSYANTYELINHKYAAKKVDYSIGNIFSPWFSE